MAKAKYWKLPGGRYGGITSRGKRFIVKSLSAAKSKLGKAVKRMGKRRKSKRTRTSNPKKTRKVRRLVRRYRRKTRRSSKSMTRTAFKLVRLGALVAPAAAHAMGGGTTNEKIKWAIRDYTGFNQDTGKWEPGYMIRGWGGYLGACLATYGIPKIISIIRRL